MVLESVFSKIAGKNLMENGVGICMDGQIINVILILGQKDTYWHYVNCQKAT